MTALGIFELNNIYQGDCVELLNKIPDNSVDLIFADPPYNLQLNGDLYRPDLSKVDAVDDEWDKFDSFGEYDQFTNQWLAECHRVLKPTGSIWVIGSYHNIFRVGTALQNIGFWILNDIIWVKSNPMPNFKGTRFNNAHETLIWATKFKSSKFTFHYHSMKVMNDDLQMRSDWVIPICQGNERIKVNGMKAHSTQKPEELLYRVLISSSNPGDVVLDPFSGSGTTAAIAKRLGRRYIAFERDEFYIRVARERLEKITPVDGKITGYPIENRIPKVPFNSLIVEDYIRLGELLYSKDGKVSATVNADGTLLHDGFVGSIHKVSAKILNRSNNNGWSFWYVMRDNKLVSIDTLRYEYEKKYIKRIQHKL